MLEQEIEDLRDSLKEYQELLSTRDKELTESERKNEKLASQVEGLEKELEKTNDYLSQAALKLEAAQQMVAYLEDQIRYIDCTSTISLFTTSYEWLILTTKRLR